MLIAVSGCPRSGTSMMMRILAKVLGEDRILGHEVPQEAKTSKRGLSEIEEYIRERNPNRRKNDQRKRAKDMNPNGYFEMAFTVKGVNYSMAFEDRLNQIKTEATDTVCKIVSQGLAQSDPRYIRKVVYMVRNPRSVAKSQERLSRQNPMTPETAPEVSGKKVLIRSVDMFNRVTSVAAHWIKRHPEIPVHIVNYDSLLDDPAPELAKLQAFLGEGDFSQAHEFIDTTLRRSAPEPINSEKGLFADMLYELLKDGDFGGIVETVEAKAKSLADNPPKRTEWFCTRLRQKVAFEICNLCKDHPQTMQNLKKNAEDRNIDWKGEPCALECGIRDGVGISVNDSIANNHWLARSV